ncbi:MAG TPA: hypothetical protein VLH84_03150 [Patescibacteria group bacterium]|nr:hypothetical protein [Patescibacteria group bacterium]
MPSTETLQHLLAASYQEAARPPESVDPALAGQVGRAAVHDELSIDEQVNQGMQNFDEGLANVLEGGNGDLQEDHRIYDVEEAHQAALVEDAHIQALAENEMFDAHAQALAENALFDAHTQAVEEDRQRTNALMEAEEAKLAQEAAKEAAGAVKSTDPQKLAEALLKKAGHNETIPASSKVHKDLATGKLMIIDKNDVKVLDGNTVVEYSVDEYAGTLTVNDRGLNYVYKPIVAQGDKAQEPSSRAITLPPAVADILHITKAEPVA